MIDKTFSLSARLAVIALFCFFAAQPLSAAEDDLKIEAKLIWGTNDDTSSNPDHKKLDSHLAKKFKKIFTWKNYFEINRQAVTIPQGEEKVFNMSSQCELRVKNLGGGRAQVKMYGEGKMVYHNRDQSLADGKPSVIAGGDKNDTAWFVVIRKVSDDEEPAEGEEEKP